MKKNEYAMITLSLSHIRVTDFYFIILTMSNDAINLMNEYEHNTQVTLADR